MNKENFSWIHYAYITITASVLAYVTYADNTNDESESALDMLPGSSAIVSDEPVDTPLIDKPVPAFAEPIPEVPLAQAVVEPVPEATVPEATVPEASVPEASVPEATESPIAPTIENKVNGGKLKKTRTNNKKYKKKQTRSRH
jgi:hypothetical protein